MSPASLGSLHPHAQGPAEARKVHRESRQGGSQIPPAPPALRSSPLFSNPGERSSPKDEISLDSLTPESYQLALTHDPFWKVTGLEKCKGCLGVEGHEVGVGWCSQQPTAPIDSK